MEILVIEDDSTQHDVLEAIFQKLEIESFFCTTGEDGLEKLLNHHFDAVLLDIGLPGKNGIQVLKTIRDTKKIQDVPVVMLTATKSKDTLVQCMKYGISDYIVKPIQIQQFAAKIMNLKKATLERQDPQAAKNSAKVLMERQSGLVKFTFTGVFTTESLKKFADIYTAPFQAIVKAETILLNFSATAAFSDAELEIFLMLTDMILPKQPMVVAGRSYGPLLPIFSTHESDLFITENDALEFLIHKK